MFESKNYSFYLCIIMLSTLKICNALTESQRAHGFVYLHEVDPTIITSLRYAGNDNFVGAPIDGYKKPVVIITQQAAEALKRVQAIVNKAGYSLVVYDAYRPQKAVDHFFRWSQDSHDQMKKSEYYPRINKAHVCELGYVGTHRSTHSRGSTVDLTIIPLGKKLHAIDKKHQQLLDGFTIEYLDDGTVNMGCSFDLFDTASHTHNDLITQEYQTRRNYLKQVMESQGFKNYPGEWWHFTLRNEPFPKDKDSSYFNFDIE